MSTCGYICPQCGGRELLDDGTPCDWCQQSTAPTAETNSKDGPTDVEWVEKVHNGCGCSDNS